MTRLAATPTEIADDIRRERFAEAADIGEKLLNDLEHYGELVRDLVNEYAPTRQRTRLLGDVAHRATLARSAALLLGVAAARARGHATYPERIAS